jgi:hypothetical protein
MLRSLTPHLNEAAAEQSLFRAIAVQGLAASDGPRVPTGGGGGRRRSVSISGDGARCDAFPAALGHVTEELTAQAELRRRPLGVRGGLSE